MVSQRFRTGDITRRHTEAASAAYHDNPLSGADCTALAGSICCHTAAHDGTGLFVFHSFWNPSGVSGICEAVLLKRARCCKP